MNDKGFFYADYSVGKITVASKTVDAGQYTVELLNQYYKDDAAARISVFRAENWELEDTLSKGYLNPRLFVEAITVINNIFTALPKLKPFNLIDIDKEKERISKLFTYENAEILDEYFRRKGKLQNIKEEYIILGILPPEYDKNFFTQAEKLLNEVNTTLGFYDNLGDDITLAFNKLKRFVSRLDELEKFSKEQLSQLATDIFGEKVIPTNTEYTSESLVARRLYFNSFYSFIVTDLFEGIQYGHYPRQCEICKKHFLMLTARRQKYCNGYAPFKHNGKRVTCRRYAASINLKERCENDPALRIYRNRCGSIRVDKSRGKITPEFAELATRLAEDRMYRAVEETEYELTQYPRDMEKKKLYEDTAKSMK